MNTRVVGVKGFEPPTSCSQSRRATNCATPRYIRFYLRFALLARFAVPEILRSLSLAKFRPLHHSRLAASAAGGASAAMPKAGALPTALHPEIYIFCF